MNDEQRQAAKQSAMLDLADMIDVKCGWAPEEFAMRFTQAEWALIIEALYLAGES